MSQHIDLPPDELSRLVVEAAVNAEQEGFWHGGGPIAEDAVRHLVRFLGLLLAGDDDINPRELDVFARVFSSAAGHEPARDELRRAVMRSVEIADDPDALHAYLNETPHYLRSILAMDRARGTRNADQVVAALGGLGMAILTADGRAELEEESVFTIHLNHLRGELDAAGVTVD